jgi:hypothetical protein
MPCTQRGAARRGKPRMSAPFKEMSVMSNPVVVVKNHTSHDICIDHDPNWDDQRLFINEKPIPDIYCLPPNKSVKVSIDVGGVTHKDEHMMGVIFSDGQDYERGHGGAYQTSIGHHPKSGLLDVTDEYVLKHPTVRYTVENRTDWSVDMNFVDF